jgi:hypothetical protein
MRLKQTYSGGDGAPARSLTLADRVRGILTTRGLTLYQVSVLTRIRYPREPAYHIPRNFYFQLRSGGLSPTLQQLYAFSQLSGYRFADWLAVFGFRVDEIPRLQATLPHPRTVLFDTRVYDDAVTVPCYRDRTPGVVPAVAPLSQLLEISGSSRISSLLEMDRDHYLYAKIGTQDAFAFPDLLPGSIVRANPRLVERLLRKPGEISKSFLLVEHSRGFSCCRLHFGTKDRLTLMATQLPFANIELQLTSQVRILGVLDMELRLAPNHRQSVVSPSALPEVASDLAELWTPASLLQTTGTRRSTLLLRAARLRAGLSFRHASEMSRAVADALHDKRYFTSPGSLSDLEARDAPPRHIHKLLTVAVLYSIRVGELLNLFGLELNGDGMAAIPDEWMDRRSGPAPEINEAAPRDRPLRSGFMATAFGRFEDLPLFLLRSLSSFSGLSEVSLRDVFWVGGQQQAMHPSLIGALFVVVNRRKRRPRAFRRRSAWEQPLYLLRKRNESYLSASCSLENGAIVLHPHTEGFVRPERLRNHIDAEVVGQIVTIVRSLPAPP